MTTFKSVNLNIPEAIALADLRGVAWDLEKAQEWARELLPQRVALTSPVPAIFTNPINPMLFEPLTIAIAVMYSRAFDKTSVRLPLGESDLTVFSSTQRLAHDYLRDYRNKYVAHSDNEFEKNLPCANYYEELVESEGFHSVGCASGRGPGLGPDNLQEVIELTSIMLNHVYARMKQEEILLLEHVNTRPLTEILIDGFTGFSFNRAEIKSRRRRQPKSKE